MFLAVERGLAGVDRGLGPLRLLMFLVHSKQPHLELASHTYVLGRALMGSTHTEDRLPLQQSPVLLSFCSLFRKLPRKAD